jgi:sulfite reductase (NADPH) hemoprotein beta-component
VAGVPASERLEIEAIARAHGLLAEGQSRLRLQGIACVALPTCPQAMAEAERYFPDFLSKVEALTAKHGLGDLDLHLRMTGCPNGCARPYLAEIGLVGKGPGRYNLMLGGDGRGMRLNKLYRENLPEARLLETLDALLGQYAAERAAGERFGDFVIRAGLVPAVRDAARDFHA